MSSIMSQEVNEIPAAAARLLDHTRKLWPSLAAQLRRRDYKFAMFCGRGSSGHAGVYMRYLLETRLGLPVCASAPSIVTSYKTPPLLQDALFVVISQSGRSPDLLEATAAARKAGAATVALLNDTDAPLAALVDHVVPLCAGEEHAVAATKTVVNAMMAGALLVSHLAPDDDMRTALEALPPRLQASLTLDWSAWGASLATASAPVVTGRGVGFGIIRELALKMTETLALPALAFSAAELKHGPRAALHAYTPVLALRQNDAVAASIDALAQELRAAQIPVYQCGGAGDLPWLGDGHAACDVLCMLPPAYTAIEREARRRGLDPDKPAGLSKVTQTL